MLALLCLTATGAWAETETITTAADLWQGAKTFTGTNVTVSVQNGGNLNGSYVSVTNTMDISVTGDNIITGLVLTIGINSGQAGYMLAQPGQCTVSGSGSHSTFVTVTDINASSVTMKMDEYAVYVEKVEVTFANPYTPTPVANTTNQWKFLMPAGDVELQVEYYPGMLTFGGDTIEGGTVEVVGLTDDALPAGFEKDAEGNIYVAEGTTFTLKAVPEEGYHFVCWSDDETNTNPEREITMPADGSDLSLSATFAENEYDITFSEGTNPDPENPEWTATPNPAKTKQTVTVTYSGTKKVIGVKAEKKSSAPTLKDALADGATVVITYTWNGTYVTTFTFTNNAGTFTGNVTGIEAEYFSKNMLQDGTTLKFTASNADYSDAYVDIRFYTDTNEYYFADKGSRFTSFTISVNGTDLTDQLSELK